MTHPDILYVPYLDTLKLLTLEDAMRICEDVYRMHARGSVVWSKPASFKLDVGDSFHNHWHVKGVLLKDIPVTGVRMYNYFNDGDRNTVGGLDCTRLIVLSDPRTGHALAIVDEHLVYQVRSTAAAVIPLQMGRTGRGEGARARRHRRDGHQHHALPADPVRFRRNPGDVAPPRDPRGLRSGVDAKSSAFPCARWIRSRRSCAAPTLRSAAPRRRRS